MNISSTPRQQAIPSNKFYPPHIDESQSLFRSHLIHNVLPQKGRDNKIIAIEAQAGQGKTTLAYQYITHYQHIHIWYQIGKEDSDPVLLLSCLLHSLTNSLEGFSSPQLLDIINKGEIGPLDLPICTNILLGDIDRHLNKDLYIVFDDLHLIAEAELTNNLLAYFVDTSPPKLHFVLTSRHPFELKSRTFRNKNAVSYLRTEDLALDCKEIESLFNDVYNRNISAADAQKIEHLTNGWVMGIVLAAHPMSGGKSGKNSTGSFSLLDAASQKDMLEYFQEEIFTHIPEELHIPFLQLSFVDEIHVELAEKITGVGDIDIVLSELTQENLFIYNLDHDFNVFRFHHLFQEFLQKRAGKTLDADQIRWIYSESASYFLEKEHIDKALSCYQQGGYYEQMDLLLRRHGVDILAKNRTLTILSLLQSIPEKVLLQYSWLTLFSGVLLSDFQPVKTLPHLEAARKLFVKSGEEIGELVSLAMIIYYHFVVSGRYNTGAALLPRTEDLLIKHQDSLSKHVRIMVQRNIASGFCFFSANMEKANTFIERARQIAIDHSITNFTASTVFIKAYIELLSGNRSKFRQEAEISYPLMNDPLVGMSNKLTLRVMHICNLSMHGDIANYFHQQQLIRDSIDEKVVKQTVAAPYFFIWGCSCLVSIGETSKALDLLNRGLDISQTAKSAHMQSQLLQWKAYIHALQGNCKHAEEEIIESSRLRGIAGGPFYMSFHHIMAGAVFSRLKKKRLAKESFAQALALADQIPSPYLQACCLMHRSHFKLSAYGKSWAIEDLERSLRLMRDNDYDHFWSWEPETSLKLLVLAVKNNIERDFAKRLARKRLHLTINDKGDAAPLLHFTILDTFSVAFGKEETISAEQFTPLMREMMSIVLLSKNMKINQEKVQLILWPDSPPEKSRKKLDTLLGRLRNVFTDNFPIPVMEYISLNKGILSLENTTSDILAFQKNCDAAFRHADREEFWQAGNRFNDALRLWKGNLPSDTFRNDTIYSFEDTLLATYENACLLWAKILSETGRQREAAPILHKMLQTNSLSENGVLQLCIIFAKTYQPLKVRETLDRYERALQAAEYENDEVSAMVNEITATLADI